MHNENEIQEIIYPPFDEKYYTVKAKAENSVNYQSGRDSFFAQYFGCLGSIGFFIAFPLLPFVLIGFICSLFIQITSTSKLAYKLYIEDCKALQNSKHY